MDILIHWGVWRHLREEIGARGWVLLTAIGLDAIVLGAFTVMKWQSDPTIVLVALVGMAAVFAFEHGFLKRNPPTAGNHDHGHGKTGEPEKASH